MRSSVTYEWSANFNKLESTGVNFTRSVRELNWLQIHSSIHCWIPSHWKEPKTKPVQIEDGNFKRCNFIQ